MPRHSTVLWVGSLLLALIGLVAGFTSIASFGSKPHGQTVGGFLFGLLFVEFARRGFREAVPRERLREGMRTLNPVEGKTRAEVRGALGPARESERMDNGRIRLTWGTSQLRVTLEFLDDVCTGVVKKTVNE